MKWKRSDSYFVFTLFLFSVLFISFISWLPLPQEDKYKVEDLQKGIVSFGNASGFIITSGGSNFIWTASHVIRAHEEDCTFPSVIFTDHEDKTWTASILHYDNIQDLAVLEVDQEEFKPGKTYTFYKESPRLSQEVWFCGCSLGVTPPSLTQGIVSGLNREIEVKISGTPYTISNLDQVSAPVFGGGSGSPIIDKNTGKVLGIMVGGRGETFSLYSPVSKIRKWLINKGSEKLLP